MKEEDLRLIASLVDWSDKLMAKVFYETYGKVIQDKFAEYEGWKNKLKDWVQQNYGNSKVPKTPRRMNPATKLLEQIQQFRVLNFDSEEEDDSLIENRSNPPLGRIPPQILKQLQNIDLHHTIVGTTSSTYSTLKIADNNETPKLTNTNQQNNTGFGHFRNLNKNFEQNEENNSQNQNVYDYPGNNANDKTPKLRKMKAAITGNSQKKVLESYKKEEQIKRLEEKANLALKHREEILKDKAERAKRDREERQRRVEENNRLKEAQLQEREKQQRLQEDRLRKFRLEQEENDKAIRSPAPKARKIGTPRAMRAPNNTLSKNTVITSSITSLQSAPPQFGNSNTNSNFAASSNTNCGTASTCALHELNESGEQIFNNDLNKKIEEEKRISNSKIENVIENSMDILGGENFDVPFEKNINSLTNQDQENANSLMCNNEENLEVESSTVRIDSVEQSMETDSPHFRPAEEAEFLNKSTKSIPVISEHSLQTPQSISFKQKHVSYEITPDKVHLPSTKDNYVIDDLSSADETDNEEAPRKDIPKWAQKPILMRKIAAQRQLLTEEQRERHFGRITQPNVNDFFGKYCREYPLRSSSALWNSPMSDPTPGVGRYIG